MFEEFEAQIMQQAAEAYPFEGVWLITSAGCRQAVNTHENPQHYFSISEADSRRAMAEGLLAVVHSHPGGVAAPSAADMQGQINTAVPWGVLSTDGVASSRIAWWGRGVPKQPLIGRKFRHGISDCYTLIKDCFEIDRGVELPEFPRDWRWWENSQNLFIEGFASAGFIRVDAEDARPGDVWLAQIHTAVVCHGGILLENDLILHQLGSRRPVDDSRLSVREPLFRYYKHITHWLRYVG